MAKKLIRSPNPKIKAPTKLTITPALTKPIILLIATPRRTIIKPIANKRMDLLINAASGIFTKLPLYV
jgi:hypothetical protein